MIGTVVMMFSYFPYVAAFATPEGQPDRIDPGLVGVGLVVAPFVLVAVAFVSHHPMAPRRVLIAMGLLPLVGLAVGLLAPAVGATAAFGVGGALTLNPPDAYGVLKWRLGAVVFTVLYTLVLLVIATPAGVFTGGILPLMMLGFADEYLLWRDGRAVES